MRNSISIEENESIVSEFNSVNTKKWEFVVK